MGVCTANIGFLGRLDNGGEQLVGTSVWETNAP